MRWNLCLANLLLAVALPATAAPIVLRGGTLVDLDDFGRSTKDVANAVVVIDGDRIVAAGAADAVAVPKDATVVDVSGKFLVPGLIDGFSAQNNEAQARAQLYMGVTTVFATWGDTRRGMSVGVPGGPSLVTIGFALGYDESDAPDAETIADLRKQARKLSNTEIATLVDATRWQGMGALLLYYSMSPEQVSAATARAKTAHVVPYGELGHTGVLDGAKRGVPVFLHANRSLIDLAPEDIRRAVADDPFGEGRSAFMRFLGELDPDAPVLREFGDAFATQRAALMPTLSLFALTLPDHANPWKEPVAAILDPRDIMLPADRETGMAQHPFDPAQVAHLVDLHRALAKRGVKYLVGSGADAFGVLPGIGAHLEMELLVRIGLTPRQALAAATANYRGLVDFIDYGVIEPGARADLLVLDADPASDVRNARKIARLFVRGKEIDRAALLTTPLEVPL